MTDEQKQGLFSFLKAHESTAILLCEYLEKKATQIRIDADNPNQNAALFQVAQLQMVRHLRKMIQNTQQ